jgi:hypothetical protein
MKKWVTHDIDLDALSTDSPFRRGFYPNSNREKRKNALKVRFQKVSKNDQFSEQNLGCRAYVGS